MRDRTTGVITTGSERKHSGIGSLSSRTPRSSSSSSSPSSRRPAALASPASILSLQRPMLLSAGGHQPGCHPRKSTSCRNEENCREAALVLRAVDEARGEAATTSPLPPAFPPTAGNGESRTPTRAATRWDSRASAAAAPPSAVCA
ncbi:unnamed protein product, partial [Ectocarpus sp. 12 AP-2014]